MRNRIYLDHASTTDVNPDVLKTYKDLLDRYYVNSESLYDEGTEINRMMEKARGAIAGLLGISSEEVIFTSGSSEANSAAIKGVCLADMSKRHIVTTNIEHSSILNACRQMERVFGYDVTYVPADSTGKVRVEDVKAALRPDTAIVSVMMVNNEVGSINPVGEIAEYVKKHSHAYMHCDLTQAVGKIPIGLANIDLASISAHKLEGLKGSGILVRRRHVPLEPLINGGEQEGGLRGGTSNALANLVMAKTLRLAMERMEEKQERAKMLQERLLAGLEKIDGIVINSPVDAVPGFVNFSCLKMTSEVMQNELNRRGFMVSARSTCASRSLDPSYVLKAMGFSDERASACIRATFSHGNTEKEIDAFLNAVKEMVQKYG